MYESSYAVSEAQGRHMVRQWLWHTEGAAICGAGTLLCLSVVGMVLSNGARALFGFLAGIACCWLVSYARAVFGRRADRDTEHEEVSLRLTDEALEMSSALAHSQMTWKGFRRAVLTTDYLVLVRRSPYQPVAIPRAALSDGAIAFIQQRVRVGVRKEGPNV